jgi:hypothetical protein
MTILARSTMDRCQTLLMLKLNQPSGSSGQVFRTTMSTGSMKRR